jgi:exosortase K
VTRRWSEADVALVAATLAGAYLLKRHYSGANADDLAWILRPTAWLVGAVTGLGFHHEAGAGYVLADRSFVIARPCAGVNFLIVAWCSATIAFVRARRGVAAKLALVGGGLAAAYALALATNTVRIAVALAIRDADLGPRALVHQLEGTVVYVAALCLAFAAARRVIANDATVHS